MKKIVLSLLIFGVVQSAFATYTPTAWFNYHQGTSIHSRGPTPDDFVPFPFGGELPFPWNITQGVWYVRNSLFESYFVFKYQTTYSHSRPRLYVEQFDVRTCAKLSVGIADELTDSGKILWATMRAQRQYSNYRLGIRAFKSTSFPKDLNIPSINGQVLVVTMSSLINPMESLNIMAEKKSTGLDIRSVCGGYQSIKSFSTNR